MFKFFRLAQFKSALFGFSFCCLVLRFAHDPLVLAPSKGWRVSAWGDSHGESGLSEISISASRSGSGSGVGLNSPVWFGVKIICMMYEHMGSARSRMLALAWEKWDRTRISVPRGEPRLHISSEKEIAWSTGTEIRLKFTYFLSS